MQKHNRPKKPPDWTDFLEGLARDGNILALENFKDYFQAHAGNKYRYLADYTKCCIDSVFAAQKVSLPVMI